MTFFENKYVVRIKEKIGANLLSFHVYGIPIVQLISIRGSFRTGSAGFWEPVNFEESSAKVKNLDKNISEYLTIQWMQNSGTRQSKFISEPLDY